MQRLRKFRAFRTNHYILKWNKEKEYCTGPSCLIPVPTASQRDSGPHLSAPRAFCSTAQRRGRCRPLSRTSGEPVARHLETRIKHWIRLTTHSGSSKSISFNHSSKANSSPGWFWISLVPWFYFPEQSIFILDSSVHWRVLSTELEFSSQQLPFIDWETRWKSFKSLSFKHLNGFLWSAFLWNRLSLTGLYSKFPNSFYLCHK